MSSNDDSGWGRSAGSSGGQPDQAPAPAAPERPTAGPSSSDTPSPAAPVIGGSGPAASGPGRDDGRQGAEGTSGFGSQAPASGSRPPSDRPERLPQQRPPEGPPDLDEFWQDLSSKLNGLLGNKRQGRGHGGGLPPPGRKPPTPLSGRSALTGLGIIGAVAGLLWLGSGFYIVQEGQVAAVLRFGQFKYMTTEAGIQWRMPYPIDTAEIVDRSRLRQIEIGYRNSVRNKVLKESLILTGDQSIVDLQFAVQYRIGNPDDFLFQNNLSAGSEELIRQVAESAIREVVGRRRTDEVLYEEKAQVAEDAQTLTQAILDRYKLGIAVVDLTIQQAQPPEQVQAAFEDANKADQDRQRLINEGQAYANDIIPRARGTADRLVLEAQGYRARVIAQAQGDALRFDQVLSQYAKAPAVTRERMYLETMQQIFSNTTKVYMDAKSNGSLLYLPLDKLMEKAGAGKPGSATAARTEAALEQAPVSTHTPQPANMGNRVDNTGSVNALRSRERSYSR
ncbi:MAG: FtsH protease activity modulator HflK [Lautropia sp.]|nr:FtsH protease activity modulator HflK [Lautropia sp.]